MDGTTRARARVKGEGRGGGTCKIKTHAHVWQRWEQTFPYVHADRLHTAACHVRTCYYAMSENSNCRLSVGRQQCKATSITEHSHLSGCCQGPVHVKQTEDIPVRREAVQFLHISIFIVVELFFFEFVRWLQTSLMGSEYSLI